ncbi:uncharacterized protein [Lepisosteus oculatus]|uniref:uncharacterized protein isoform X3 n=1 Tax=Lepisosteus oculatus TaxID=7918 RepID=UPI0035F52FA4
MEPLSRFQTNVQRAMSTEVNREDVQTHQRLETSLRVRPQTQRAHRLEKLAQVESGMAEQRQGCHTETWGRSHRNVLTEVDVTLKGWRGATDTEALSKDSSSASQPITRQETETQLWNYAKGPERDLQKDRAWTSSLAAHIPHCSPPHTPPHPPPGTPAHPGLTPAALWRLREGLQVELEGLLQEEEIRVRTWAQNMISSIQLDCLALYNELLPDFESEGAYAGLGTGIMKQDNYEEVKEALKSYFENTVARCDLSEVNKCFRQAAAELDLILQKYLGDVVAEVCE